MLSLAMLKRKLLWLQTLEVLFVLLLLGHRFWEIIWVVTSRAFDRIRLHLHHVLDRTFLSRFHSLYSNNVVVKIFCLLGGILLLD